MKHLTADQLSARHDRALGGRELEAVDRHLAACAPCREALAALAEQDARLGPALTHDPGSAYFETFAARVEDRLRAAGLRGAQARLDGGGLLGWLRSPRRVAWVGAVAAVVGGAAIVILTARDVEKPTVGREWSRPSPPAPPAREAAAPRAAGEDAPERAKLGEADHRAARAPAGAEVQPSEKVGPVASSARANQVADERMAPEAVSQEEANAPAKGSPGVPAPTAALGAAPRRLQEVRRTSGGEEAPVERGEFRFALPPASPSATTQEGPVRVAKPRGAEPLEGRSQAKALGAADQAGGARPIGEVRLCGAVIDPAGRPVAGAHVVLADNARAATTDSTGRFCLVSPPGDHDLSVMAIGFHSTREQVRVVGESSEIAVTLRPVPVLDRAVGALTRDRPEALEGLTRDHVEGSGTPARRSRDVFGVLPESLRAAVRSAERLSAAAAADTSAARFDAAAAAWERALAGIPAGPERTAARFALASARYDAWASEPGPTRERAARRALSSFLARAPPGPERVQATRWLERLGR